MTCGLYNPSSPAGDRTWAPAVKASNPNYWTTRKFSNISYMRKKMSQNSGCNVDTGRSLGDGCNWKGQSEYLSDILADMSRKEFFTLGYGSGSGSDDKGRSLENQGESPTPLPNPRVPWHMGELPAMTYKSCVGEKNQNSAKVMNAGNILVKSFGVSGQHSACVPSQQTYLVYSHSSESPDCSPSLGHH